MAKQLSCGIEILRGILLFFNVLFVLIGLALIGIGIYIKVDNKFASILADLANVSEFKGQSFGFFAFIMIGGGVFTLLVALLGCIGSLYHNRCLLYFYAIILIILMILELVGVILAVVYKSKLTDVYRDTLSNVFDKALQNNQTDVLSFFRQLEDAMKCCGVHGIVDYKEYPSYPKSDSCKKIPESIGCSDAIIDFLNKNLPIIGGTLGGILGIELFGMIAAIALAIAVKNAPGDRYSSSPGFGFSNKGSRFR